ncbi:hypothetical protein [Peterkaempfera griseoplana]|uniref:hypothetical protein n=1 Tax=Peterkaempfera griseoplana TaxID=66896 RepID=UPI0012FE95F0|nr:hypothetical protein [Peterkaempfera griseoplana]
MDLRVGPATAGVQRRYGTPKPGHADAVARDHDTGAGAGKVLVLTLDRRDFRAVRPLSRHKSFRILPDDLPL